MAESKTAESKIAESKIAESQKQRFVKWIARSIGLALLVLAISTHFRQTADHYVPEIRSARRVNVPAQFVGRDYDEIEKEIHEIWSPLAKDKLEEDRYNAPATEEEIASLENLIGARLPPDYRAFLKIHNGEKGVRPTLLSIEKMKSELSNFHGYIEFGYPVNRVDRVNGEKIHNANLWWPGLVLITESGGIGKAIDCSTGKIIAWDHDGWSLSVENENFTEYLETVIKESGAGYLTW